MTKREDRGDGTLLDERLHQKRPEAGLVEADTKIYLRVVSGPEAGRVIDVSRGGSFILGRVKADIVLSDEKVSSRHAELKFFLRGITTSATLRARTALFSTACAWIGADSATRTN